MLAATFSRVLQYYKFRWMTFKIASQETALSLRAFFNCCFSVFSAFIMYFNQNMKFLCFRWSPTDTPPYFVVCLAMSVKASCCSVPIPNGLIAAWYLAFTFSHCQQTPAEATPGISEEREFCYQVLLKVTLHCNCPTLQTICVVSKIVVLCKEAKANSPAVSEGDSVLMREVNNLHTWSVWIHVCYKSFLKTACIDVRLCSEMSRVCHSCKQQECTRPLVS